MSISGYINHILFMPQHDQRRYDFDLEAVRGEVTRVALVALPFLAMVRPIGWSLSVGMGSVRALSHTYEALCAQDKKEWTECGVACAKTALATFLLAATVWQFTTGLFVKTAVDLVETALKAAEHIQKGERSKALEEALQAMGTTLYLAFMLLGSLELALLSVAVQAAVCFMQARSEMQEERYLEAAAKVVLGCLRLRQANGYRCQIQRRNKLLQVAQCQRVAARVARARAVSHLVRGGLAETYDNIDEKTVVLRNQEGEYEFGAHTHGYGKGLVKGANLSFRQVTVGGKEMTEIEFKVNHVFRSQIDDAISDLRGKKIGEVLSLTQAHTNGVSINLPTEKLWFFDSPENATVDFAGLGTLEICPHKEIINSYDKVIIRMDADKTLFDLHEVLALANLDTALWTSTTDDLERLKMGHLFHTFCPREATPFERTEEFFSLPIEELRQAMIEKNSAMKGVFDRYLEKMTPEEILPGRIRYRMNGLADEVRAAGGRALTASMVASYWSNNEEAAKRLASVLSMGMIASELKDTYRLDGAGGLGNDYFTGGADSIFTQMVTQEMIDRNADLGAFYGGRVRLMISLDALETGTYQYHYDALGHRIVDDESWWWDSTYPDRDNIIEFTEAMQQFDSERMEWWEYAGNEVMIKERLDPRYIEAVLLDSEETKRAMIAYFRKENLIERDELGGEILFGRVLNTFFRVGMNATNI